MSASSWLVLLFLPACFHQLVRFKKKNNKNNNKKNNWIPISSLKEKEGNKGQEMIWLAHFEPGKKTAGVFVFNSVEAATKSTSWICSLVD